MDKYKRSTVNFGRKDDPVSICLMKIKEMYGIMSISKVVRRLILTYYLTNPDFLKDQVEWDQIQLRIIKMKQAKLKQLEALIMIRYEKDPKFMETYEANYEKHERIAMTIMEQGDVL